MVFYPINYERSWPREIDIMVVERFGDQFQLLVDDGSGFVRSFNSSHFKLLNVRNKCNGLKQSNMFYVDKEVCDLFPASKYNLLSKVGLKFLFTIKTFLFRLDCNKFVLSFTHNSFKQLKKMV